MGGHTRGGIWRPSTATSGVGEEYGKDRRRTREEVGVKVNGYGLQVMGVNLCRKTFDNYIREDGWMSYIVRLVCVAVVAVLQFKIWYMKSQK